MADRKWVLVSDVPSVLEKRFRRALTGRRNRISYDPKGYVNDLAVIRDLRRGCLKSLDWYLSKYGGIPDRHVAIEIRKLLFGTRRRAKYRIIAVQHPDGPRPTKGRPKRLPTDQPTGRNLQLATAYRESLAQGNQPEYAADAVAVALKTKPSAVFRAQKVVQTYEDTLAALESESARRTAALAAAIQRADQALEELRKARS